MKNIISPLDNDLKRFNDYFKNSLKSKVGLVDLVTKYILKQKGKKIRPVLVFFSAKMLGEVDERAFRGATLVELLHTATLVHDDVVDGAEKRRGLPSINAIWKNKISVLMGDYLLAKGLMIAVDGGDYDFLKIITDTVKRMSEGELLQISKTKKLDIDEETYFRIISDKTASLLSTCCQIGSLSSSDSDEYQNALKNFGEYLGIAFQIRDDILDYVGTNSFGKPLGADIKEKKITLPLIHALSSVDPADKSKIIKKLKKINKKDSVKEIINFVKSNGGIDYSERIALDYAEKAKNELSIFPDTASKKSMIDIVDFVINRKK